QTNGFVLRSIQYISIADTFTTILLKKRFGTVHNFFGYWYENRDRLGYGSFVSLLMNIFLLDTLTTETDDAVAILLLLEKEEIPDYDPIEDIAGADMRGAKM